MHIVIFIDALFHLIILGCVVAVWVLFVRFSKIVRKAGIPHLRYLLGVMFTCVICMTYFAAADFWYCVHQYVTWWSK